MCSTPKNKKRCVNCAVSWANTLRNFVLKPCVKKIKLLFLHGFAGSGQDWDFYLRALSENYACEAPDLPGHGNNSESILSFEHTVQTLKAKICSEAETAWIIIGYSLGGRLALALASESELSRQICALVLISSSPGLKTEAERIPRQAWEKQWAKRFSEELVENTFQAWYAQPLFGQLQDLPIYVELQKRRAKNSGKALAQSMLALGSGAQPLLWSNLPQLHLPCLCLCGAEDIRYLGLNCEMARLMPQAEVKVLPGVAHALHLESPPNTLAALLPFLENQRGVLK
jgi:2-succinyl-6-hydroxy-2,4-cyclohexadiene-1-carboxylate synthase